ncbi:hypothetical protein ASE72_06560 [Sphingomonas sp. Leaf20]|nr:hypothetical protein ASE72_06560 [Sphingomonas sp. Leaf20]
MAMHDYSGPFLSKHVRPEWQSQQIIREVMASGRRLGQFAHSQIIARCLMGNLSVFVGVCKYLDAQILQRSTQRKGGDVAATDLGARVWYDYTLWLHAMLL